MPLPLLLFGIPILKLVAGIGAIFVGIVGIANGVDQIKQAANEGKVNRERRTQEKLAAKT